MEVYKPDDYTISIGVPADLANLLNMPWLPTHVEIKDWISITSDKSVQRFNHSTGIHGEPFVEMNRNSSRVFNLNILQASPDIKMLRALFRLQTFGIVGFPFSIFNGGISAGNIFDVDSTRQKSLYPVAYIVDEPSESYTLEGTTWVYKLQTLAGATVYI